jgi:hypothetical protein
MRRNLIEHLVEVDKDLVYIRTTLHNMKKCLPYGPKLPDKIFLLSFYHIESSCLLNYNMTKAVPYVRHARQNRQGLAWRVKLAAYVTPR